MKRPQSPRRQNSDLEKRRILLEQQKVGEVTLSSNWPGGHRVPVPAVDFIIRLGGGLEQRLQGIYRPLKRFSIT